MPNISEKEFSNDVFGKLNLWFESYKVSKIHKEYNLNGFRSDYFLETEKCNVVIELKLNLRPSNIGQLLNYIVLAQKKSKKNVVGCLIFTNKTIKELTLSIDVIKHFNLNILLIDFTENKLYKKDNISNDYNIKDEMCIEGIKYLSSPKIIYRPVMKRAKNKKKIKVERPKILPLSSPHYNPKII